MRMPRLSNGFLALGLLSASLLGATSCNSEYGLFSISAQFSVGQTAADRQNIESCKLTITDEKGDKIVSGYLIPQKRDSENNLVSGCGAAETPQRIGTDIISYSTSRTSGQLTFTMDALNNTEDVVQSGSDTKGVKVFHSKGDIVPVDITLSKK
jgi:hypothetical protein